MTKLMLILTICLATTGCVTGAVQDAIDAADERVRLKWAEEWRPALLDEARGVADKAKDMALSEMVDKLEAYDDRLDQMGIKVSSHDADGDGRLQIRELSGLLTEIKEKNEHTPNPLTWYEIAVIVAGAYLPTTALKETLKSKMKPKSAAA